MDFKNEKIKKFPEDFLQYFSFHEYNQPRFLINSRNKAVLKIISFLCRSLSFKFENLIKQYSVVQFLISRFFILLTERNLNTYENFCRDIHITESYLCRAESNSA